MVSGAGGYIWCYSLGVLCIGGCGFSMVTIYYIIYSKTSDWPIAPITLLLAFLLAVDLTGFLVLPLSFFLLLFVTLDNGIAN